MECYNNSRWWSRYFWETPGFLFIICVNVIHYSFILAWNVYLGWKNVVLVHLNFKSTCFIRSRFPPTSFWCNRYSLIFLGFCQTICSLSKSWSELFPLQRWRCWSAPCWGWPSCCWCPRSPSASCASPSQCWWTASTRSLSSLASLWLLRAPAEAAWAPLWRSLGRRYTLPTSLLSPPIKPQPPPLPEGPSGRSLPELWAVVCPTASAGFPWWGALSPLCSWPLCVSPPPSKSLAFSWSPSRSGSPCCSWSSALPAFSSRRCFFGSTGISCQTLCWTEKVRTRHLMLRPQTRPCKLICYFNHLCVKA